MADSLVKARAGLNVENNHGETPLKLAKSSGTFNLKSKHCGTLLFLLILTVFIKGHRAEYESMLSQNGKKAGYSQVYDDPEVLIDAASNGEFSPKKISPCKKKLDLFLGNSVHVILGNLDRISELIKTVDIDIQNDVGDTALIRASEVGKSNLLKRILQ